MSLKVVLKGVKWKKAVLPYPFQPAVVPEDFRGKPELSYETCIGCGACAQACPPEAIKIYDDVNTGTRKWVIFYGRCIFCGRCEESCPVGAIKQTEEFELSSTKREDLETVAVFKLYKDPLGDVCDYTVREYQHAITLLSLSSLGEEGLKDLMDRLSLSPRHKVKNTIDSIVEALKPGLKR